MQRILPIGMSVIMGECPRRAEQRVSLSPTQHVGVDGDTTLKGHLSHRTKGWFRPCDVCMFASLGWLVSEIYFLKLSWKHEVRFDLTLT